MEDFEKEQIAEFVDELTQHQRRLFRYIYKFIRNHQETDDLLQQTNMVLWKKYKTYELDTNFFGWASRVAFFEVQKFLKSKGRQNLLFDETLLSMIEERQAAREDLHTLHSIALIGCIGKLSPVNQQLIKLCYDGRYSIQQVAKQLERPVGSVYTLLSRIRRKLLECVRHATMEGGEI